MSVEKIINKVIVGINENPLIYHREADIRAMLYNELCKEYPELHPTKLGYKTGLVHCEYFGGDRTRIDIVVFDKDDVKNIQKHSLEKRKIGVGDHVKINDAIEIKTELGWQGDKQKDLAYDDIDKLLKLKKKNPKINLYFLYFVRWPTKKKQKKTLNLVGDIKKRCGKNGIIFKTNDKSDYFLQNPQH